MLLGDATKARKELGWEPKVTFKELAKLMVDADIESAGKPSTGRDRPVRGPARDRDQGRAVKARAIARRWGCGLR